MTALAMDVRELSFEEIDLVAAANGQEVANGVAVYGAATMALCMATGPIGWGVGVSYLIVCAAAGYMIGEGLRD